MTSRRQWRRCRCLPAASHDVIAPTDNVTGQYGGGGQRWRSASRSKDGSRLARNDWSATDTVCCCCCSWWWIEPAVDSDAGRWCRDEFTSSMCDRRAGEKCDEWPPPAHVSQVSPAISNSAWPSLQDRLMNINESWGVKGHTTRCTSPVSVVLRIRANETEISAALWAHETREGL